MLSINRIFLTGVSCVGKTTIGSKLAGLLGYRFYDLDAEVETFYGISIEHLQKRFKSMTGFRNAAAIVLEHIISNTEGHHCVVVLPPRGLMNPYWNVVRAAKAITVVIQDKPENILRRIMFYDIDSHPIKMVLSETQRRFYLQDIAEDIIYFRRSYQKATMVVDISGLNAEDSACKIKSELGANLKKKGENIGPFL